ncbi:MAG: ABC transporter ATP-binding protein [Lachnospiraceae bacterium]
MLEVKAVTHQYDKMTVLKDVSLRVADGECVSLVGTSGSGKSTLGRLILALEKPVKGEVNWNGRPVRAVKRKQLYRDIQPVFQDNTSCFNPRRKVIDSLTEPMRYLLGLNRTERERRAGELLEMTGLPADVLERYPHELSGGQQKRICIARAISIRPKFILLDEAVSGLDAVVMVKILDLLKELQKEVGCSYLFITHDIGAAGYMSNTIKSINVNEEEKDEKENI